MNKYSTVEEVAREIAGELFRPQDAGIVTKILRQHGYGAQGHDRDWILQLGKFRKALDEAGLHCHYNLFQQFFGETLESDLTFGQGVGPRCPKCSGQLGFTHNRILTFLSCYKCKETFELHSAEDMVKFFSPVPSPESATEEGE